ncbi:MAG: metallophosphoesterase [Hyphomicrobiales bacterium]|nr:MAG: metallophosphoesterase [Hyphomicrobiales bacterium]
MKVAVISDIHGNLLAFEAVLADIAEQGVDITVNLGDLVSGPMQPREALARVMALGHPTIRGNHERTLFVDKPDIVDHFAVSQLTGEQIDWIKALPATLVVGDLFLCHGTPTSDTQPWLDNWWEGRDTTLPGEADVVAHAAGLDHPVLLCGHTHIPRIVRLRDGRLIVNPGSVGLQIVRGAPDARYAIIERRNGLWQGAIRSVPYDWAAAARTAAANGFPQWQAPLETGWVGPEGLFTRS